MTSAIRSPIGPSQVPSGFFQARPSCFPGVADDALRVLRHALVGALHDRIVTLRLDVAATDLDGVELIAADAAVEDLL